MTSLSLVAVPGSMPASAARASVLVRFPLWPRANSTGWARAGFLDVTRYTGWALCQVEVPVVE